MKTQEHTRSENSKTSLALFFTRGISLDTWVSKGMFYREKLLYEKHLENNLFESVYWVTYGPNDRSILKTLQTENQINASIDILEMPNIYNSYIGNIIYSFISPYVHKKALKRCSIFKSNQMDGSWSAIIASKLCGGKSVIRSGYSLTRFLKTQKNKKLKKYFFDKVERLVYKKSDLAFVTTNSDKDHLNKNYNAKQIVVVPNYIDTNLFYDQNIPRHKNKLLFVGRLDPVKNLKNMLVAADRANIDVDLIGNGPLKEELVELSRSLKTKVTFLGNVPNNKLPEIYNSYKYFILSSITEGMPKVLIEAMACGCICIGTNVQGINEVIRDKENGVLAKNISSEAIYEAMEKTLSLSASEQKYISDNAILNIVNEYSLLSITALEQKQFTQN